MMSSPGSNLHSPFGRFLPHYFREIHRLVEFAFLLLGKKGFVIHTVSDKQFVILTLVAADYLQYLLKILYSLDSYS